MWKNLYLYTVIVLDTLLVCTASVCLIQYFFYYYNVQIYITAHIYSKNRNIHLAFEVVTLGECFYYNNIYSSLQTNIFILFFYLQYNSILPHILTHLYWSCYLQNGNPAPVLYVRTALPPLSKATLGLSWPLIPGNFHSDPPWPLNLTDTSHHQSWVHC